MPGTFFSLQSDTRSGMAAEKLAYAGFRDLYVVEGGTDAAIRTGIPMTLRQRLGFHRAPGANRSRLLVLSGALAGVLLHSGFLWIPGFVGAGLPVRWNHGHLRHGPAFGEMPVEALNFNTPDRSCFRNS